MEAKTTMIVAAKIVETMYSELMPDVPKCIQMQRASSRDKK